MLASRVAQALIASSRTPLGSFPAIHARALFATKKADPQEKSTAQKLKEAVVEKVKDVTGAASKKGTPAGEQGRDVRDMGTGKVNVPVGQPTKKADSPDSKFGGKAPGMAGANQRGHEEVSGGLKSATGKASAQQPASSTNYQPKRSFSFTSTAFAKDSKDSKVGPSKGKDTSGGDKSNDSDTFVSKDARKDMNPSPSGQKSNYKNVEFYPEPPGYTLDPRNEEQSQQHQKGGSMTQKQKNDEFCYDTNKNPSSTGKQAESRYMDEALSGKPGPLTGPSSGGSGGEGKKRK